MRLLTGPLDQTTKHTDKIIRVILERLGKRGEKGFGLQGNIFYNLPKFKDRQ